MRQTKSSNSDGFCQEVAVLEKKATRVEVFTSPHFPNKYRSIRVLYLGGHNIVTVSFLPGMLQLHNILLLLSTLQSILIKAKCVSVSM